MRIINRYTHGRKIYQDGLTEIRYKDILYLAAYLRKELGFGDKRVEKKIIEYCENLTEDFSSFNSSDMIGSVVRNSRNLSLEDVEFVEIYRHEIDTIQEMKDFSVQVFVFSLLIYNKIFYKNSKSFYLDIYTTKDILDMTGMKMSIDRFLTKHYFIMKSSNLSYHTPGKNYVKIKIDRKNGELVEKIYDFKNLKSIYKEIVGGEFYYCEKCGGKIKKRVRKEKYCTECKQESHKESKRNWWNNKH